MKRFRLIVILILLFSGCNYQDKKTPSIRIDLPDTSLTHLPNFNYEIKKKAEEELMLNRLENGSDTLELRLWANVEVLSGGQIFIIKKINRQWTCLHYEYITKQKCESSMNWFDYAKDFSIDTFLVKKLQPKTNWKNLYFSLEKENIFNLPNQSEIKGWENMISDGNTFKVEFATNDYYKFYSYNCPDVYENKFIECKQMSNILNVFNKEFGLNMYPFYKNSYRCH